MNTWKLRAKEYARIFCAEYKTVKGLLKRNNNTSTHSAEITSSYVHVQETAVSSLRSRSFFDFSSWNDAGKIFEHSTETPKTVIKTRAARKIYEQWTVKDWIDLQKNHKCNTIDDNIILILRQTSASTTCNMC